MFSTAHSSTSLSDTINRRTHCAHYPRINTNALSHFKHDLKLVGLKWWGNSSRTMFFLFFLKQPINHSQVVTLNDCQLSLYCRTGQQRQRRRREIREEKSADRESTLSFTDQRWPWMRKVTGDRLSESNTSNTCLWCLQFCLLSITVRGHLHVSKMYLPSISLPNDQRALNCGLNQIDKSLDKLVKIRGKLLCSSRSTRIGKCPNINKIYN